MANRATVIAGSAGVRSLWWRRTRSPDTETTAYADVILPAALWAEADGVMVNSERTLTHCAPATPPPGECSTGLAAGSAGWQRRWAIRRFDFDSADQVFAELAAFHNPRTGWDLRGVDYERLRRVPVQWPARPGRH